MNWRKKLPSSLFWIKIPQLPCLQEFLRGLQYVSPHYLTPKCPTNAVKKNMYTYTTFQEATYPVPKFEIKKNTAFTSKSWHICFIVNKRTWVKKEKPSRLQTPFLSLATALFFENVRRIFWFLFHNCLYFVCVFFKTSHCMH